ncbi:MAG: PEP-CTERM sorting domain-containing protein [Verrucomicrobia bacterium]|nr:PEP-CTERM sorting domain-containing protein [Verrucomicrobiota bacterium]
MKLLPLLILSAAVYTLSARGDTFTLDPTASTLTVSGNNIYVGMFAPQGANSLTTSYSGTIDATVTANSITFNSAALAAAVSGNWQPAAGGAAGSAPADYGITFAPPYTGLAYAAIRNLVLDLSSNAIPTTAGSFDSTQISIAASSGTTDYTGPLGSGSIDLTKLGSGPNGAMPGILTMVGGIETLTIPISFSETLSVVGPNDTTATFTGTMVATEMLPVPEPGSWVLMLGGLGALLLFQRTRFRRVFVKDSLLL